MVKKIFVNDLSNQTNAQTTKQTVGSVRYGNTGAEGFKLLQFHVCPPVGENANDEINETKGVGIFVSRTRKTRQLTEKGKQYQINLMLD